MHAKKRFGQNFLVDTDVIERIIAIVNPKASEHFIEIGPGHGAITYPLLSRITALEVIEIDRELALKLESTTNPKLMIHQQDVLEFDFNQIKHTFRLIGNLPYNISTPLLFHLCKYRNKMIDLHVMLQKEVAERIHASVGNKSYGRLSVMMQYYFDSEICFHISSHAFKPAPKVKSTFMNLIPKKNTLALQDEEIFSEIVRIAFCHRRKTIRNALKEFSVPFLIEHSDLNPNMRPEIIPLEQYVNLSNLAYDLLKSKS